MQALVGDNRLVESFVVQRSTPPNVAKAIVGKVVNIFGSSTARPEQSCQEEPPPHGFFGIAMWQSLLSVCEHARGEPDFHTL